MTDRLAPPSSGETTIQSFQFVMFCLIQLQNNGSTCSQRKCYKDVKEINIPSKNPLDDRKILPAVVNEDPSSSNGLPLLSSACLPPTWQWWASGEMTSGHPGMRWCQDLFTPDSASPWSKGRMEWSPLWTLQMLACRSWWGGGAPCWHRLNWHLL